MSIELAVFLLIGLIAVVYFQLAHDTRQLYDLLNALATMVGEVLDKENNG